jgi:hypothetical protein
MIQFSSRGGFGISGQKITGSTQLFGSKKLEYIKYK